MRLAVWLFVGAAVLATGLISLGVSRVAPAEEATGIFLNGGRGGMESGWRPPERLAVGLVKVDGGVLPSNSKLGEAVVLDFEIGRFEVTWGEWKTVRDWSASHGYDLGEVGLAEEDSYPVSSVSWHDALKWCNARSESEGLACVYYSEKGVYRRGNPAPREISMDTRCDGYRLPLEAEWEWAARGGIRSKRLKCSGGNRAEEVAWFNGNSDQRAHPVGLKCPNELGLYDMSGNVWEWCWNGADPLSEVRMLRGGSWHNAVGFCANQNRDRAKEATFRGDDHGFRVVRQKR
jgi:formylglycine-generating enzyme required for sulfatase activity